MSDFELHRLEEKITELGQEHEQLNHQILQTRRNEQFELDIVRRRFDGIIRRLEERRIEIEKEVRNFNKQLERVEAKIAELKTDEEKKPTSHRTRRFLA